MSPPSAEPVISIGVTGHRFLAEIDRVVEGIDQALRRIQSAYPGSTYHILSAIAEGADRIVADRAMKVLNAKLTVFLPMDSEEYEQDFGTPKSVAEFRQFLSTAESVIQLPPNGDRALAYENVGRSIVNQADVILAVWDGRAAQGKGGVGEIVRIARDSHKPLLIVSAGNRKPGTNEPTSLGDRQGALTAERLP